MLEIIRIQQALERLRPLRFETPCVRTPWLEEAANGPVFCKLENLQRTGSFKFRGAMNSLLQLDAQILARGIVTASAGNHGLGVAAAARMRGCAAKIFVPENVASAKRQKLQALGAELIITGRDYDEAEAAAQHYAHAHAQRFLHAFDDDEVIAGQGTVGMEIHAQLPNAGTVIVPVGGGGLIGGLSLAVKSLPPAAKIYGVQSEASPAMHAALAQGRVVETPIAETIADGLAGRFVTEKTLRLAQQYCDAMLLVREESIRRAMRELYVRHGWRVEGSAAVGVAAILEGKVDAAGRECAVIISGGNIAEEVFSAAIQTPPSLVIQEESF